MKAEKINLLRVISLSVIVIATLFISFVLAISNHFMVDEGICLLFLDIVFLAILLFELEYERKSRLLANNAATTYFWLAGGYVLCCGILPLMNFCPDFYRPFMLIPFILCMVGNTQIGMIAGLFFQLLFGLTCSGNYYELVCACLLTILFCILSRAFEQSSLRIWATILLFCVNLLFPMVFSYWYNGQVVYKEMLYGTVIGIIMVFLSIFLYGKIKRKLKQETEHKLEEIMDDSYIQKQELKKYFPADYEHAQLVARIAGSCGEFLGYSKTLCTAAGFYYRMGKWIGEPYIQNGVDQANSLCFPVEMTQILAEYYGEEQLPSTPESALVHMVDALVFKMNALMEEVGGSQWNREMIIYQTLNEFSTSGLYDQSGLSMNQFLQLRGYLVKEDLWQ